MVPAFTPHITNPLADFPQATERASRVRLLVLDVDGVLTNGQVFFGQDGKETLKGFDIQDGHGIKLLQSVGIECAVITGRHSKMVLGRCDELGIVNTFTGVKDKRSALDELCKRIQVNTESELAIMGDDWPDLPILMRAGFRIAPAQAHVEVRQVAHYITKALGGFGAVREVCDLILKAQGHYEALLATAKR
jgi:3-deoxy-D-manno-octulosonate 8-phosphate phosphatase (KDO 8-P phosphatase)